MAIVTLDAPLPRVLPNGLETLVPALRPHTYTQACLFLLRLHQMGDGQQLLVGDNLQGVGDSEWPYEMHTYAWSATTHWICLVWQDGTIALGQRHHGGGWCFLPTPFELHPYACARGNALGLFERDMGFARDLDRLAGFPYPPLLADRWGTPWLSGFSSPVAAQTFLRFVRNAMDAANAEAPARTLLLHGAIGLGNGRWVAPDIAVDFRTHPQGPAWDDIRCVLAHRPPLAPNTLIEHVPYWSGSLPTTFEPQEVGEIQDTYPITAHERLAFQKMWPQRLAEARDLQDRGLCRPDTLAHPDEDL